MNRLAAAALIFTTACTGNETKQKTEQSSQPILKPERVERAEHVLRQQLPIHQAVIRCVENPIDPQGFFDEETQELIPPCPDPKAQIWL